MAAATSSGASTATLQMRHSGVEQTRKRIDPKRRQAALSFLSNISLDGRPVQDDAENPEQEDEPPEARTSLSAASPERAAAAAAATAAQALALANQALLANNRASSGLPSSPGGTDAEADASTPSTFNSPFSALPASTRGRLQTYTQGIVPAPYSRQFSPNYCPEIGQIEPQRSR